MPSITAPSPLLPEPYRCRFRYLWAGIKDAWAGRDRKKAEKNAERKAHMGLKLLAPFAVLLLLGPLLGATAAPIVRALRALLPENSGYVVMGAMALATLALPGYGLVLAWRGAQKLCYRGWELSQAALAGVKPPTPGLE
jgi:hypothetical protein